MPNSIGGLIFTSNRISRLFLSGSPKAGLKKCEAYFFKRQKAAVFRLSRQVAGPAREQKQRSRKGVFNI